MTKQQRIAEYNKANIGYNITGVRKLNREYLRQLELNSPKSLDELYKSYSDIKKRSFEDILKTYKPKKVIGLQGSSMAYSVTLIADNGSTLWITRNNNYLVEAS